jgi:hypothetical protein
MFSIKNLLVLGLAISGATAGVITTDRHQGRVEITRQG